MTRATTAFIFVTVLIDVLALGIVIPVLPKLIEHFVGGDTAQAARINGGFAAAWALMQCVFMPLLGALSDRFGRRPVLLLSCLGLALDYVLMALAPDLWWLFVGRVVSGMTAASFSTAGAYVADVTPADRRAAAFGLLGAAWGLGFVLGPAAGGLLGGIDPRLPFWVAGALALANFAYGLFVLPESLAPAQRSARIAWRRANPLGALALLREHRGLPGLALLNALYWFAHYALPATFVLYGSHRYGWSSETVGLTLAVVGLLNVFVQAVLVPRVVPRFGERATLVAGLAAGATGFLIYGLAPTALLFWVGMPVFALMGLFGPALQALMSQRVGAEAQGRLQGANGSVAALVGLVAPPAFSAVFALGISPAGGGQWPGAAMLLAAATLLLALCLAPRASRAAAGSAA